MSKELIRLTDCVMAFDEDIVLDKINLSIKDKEFLTLLGPSGCGKTTTLRIIGGFQTPTAGDVLFDGVRINAVPPHKRTINTVFQKYALFPHLNVYENIAFGLRIPKAALHLEEVTEEDPDSSAPPVVVKKLVVYASVNGHAEMREVSIVHEDEDYYVVRPLGTGKKVLRDGDVIITHATGLIDGLTLET